MKKALLTLAWAAASVAAFGGVLGKDLIASGGRQGGMRTIRAAACGEGVTRAEIGIARNCDMYANGRR